MEWEVNDLYTEVITVIIVITIIMKLQKQDSLFRCQDVIAFMIMATDIMAWMNRCNGR